MKKTIYLWGKVPLVKETNVNGRNVNFPMRIRNYVVYDNLVIIKLYSEKLKDLGEDHGRNIWCYNSEGKLLWKIEESPRYLKWPKKAFEEDPNRRDTYTYVAYDEKDKKILAHVGNGYYELDPDTGKISNFIYDGGR